MGIPAVQKMDVLLRYWSLHIFTIFVLVLQSHSAFACMGPHTRIFPVCEIAAPDEGERVSLIYSNGGEGLSSVAIDNTLNLTEVVDIEVSASERDHYIAISSGKSVIWRFFGDTDSISRVIVLGSQYQGPKHTGVVGLPPDRIVYAKTDLKALDLVGWDSCTSLYRACELSASFEIPKADRMVLAGKQPKTRLRVDQFVERLKGHTIRIPGDGWSEARKRGRWKTENNITKMTGPAAGRYEAYVGSSYSQAQTYKRGVIKISPNDVVATLPVVEYQVLPGETGLKNLVDQGILSSPGTQKFDETYKQWNEAISAPFQSRFDPNFQFSYKVDYLITKPTQLPNNLHNVSFLVADGVKMPDFGNNRPFRTCLFFADGRKFAETQQDDPRCDQAVVTVAIPDAQSAYSRSKIWLQSHRETGIVAPEACLFTRLENGTSLAAVVVSEGVTKRYTTQNSRRRIDIKVERPGKVAIYLDMDGGRTDWHILPSPNSEIVKVFTRLPLNWSKHRVVGIDKSVPVQSLSGGWNRDQRCLDFSPSYNAHLGGPAIMQLDESLRASVGKRIDYLVRETNDGSWPKQLDRTNGPRATFTIR